MPFWCLLLHRSQINFVIFEWWKRNVVMLIDIIIACLLSYKPRIIIRWNSILPYLAFSRSHTVFACLHAVNVAESLTKLCISASWTYTLRHVWKLSIGSHLWILHTFMLKLVLHNIQCTLISIKFIWQSFIFTTNTLKLKK